MLKSASISQDALFSWNIVLSRLGIEIWKCREKMVIEINKELTRVYQSIAENGDEVWIELRTDACEKTESGYFKKLEDGYERDKILGHTSFGAHRDNYEFWFNKRLADGSASRGEVRSIVVAMKFIEADMILKTIGKAPVVLLDDVFSELDETRQKALVYNFKKNQVIITSVNAVEDIETS